MGSLSSTIRSWRRRTLCLGAIVVAVSAAGLAHGAALPPLSPQGLRYWTAVASCETGGGGPPKWDWGSKHRPGEGTLFEGGVGFSALMWQLWANELGLLKQYPHAYSAPAIVQMRVAEYGLKVRHATWGCSP